MISIRVEAHILPSTKRCATASAEQLNLDRSCVGWIIENVPLWNSTLRQTDEQSLHGICVGGALGRVTIPSRAVSREDRGIIKVWKSNGVSHLYLLDEMQSQDERLLLFCSLRI